MTELGELQATGMFPQYSNADVAGDIASHAKDWIAQYMASVGRGAANFGNAFLNKIVQNGPQGSYVNPGDLNRTSGGGGGTWPTAGAVVADAVPCRPWCVWNGGDACCNAGYAGVCAENGDVKQWERCKLRERW